MSQRIRADLHGKCGSCKWAEPLANTSYIRCINQKMRVHRLSTNKTTADIKRRTNRACKKFYEERTIND